MSDIASLIEVFKMQEIAPETRANIIVDLGLALNHQFGSNITEPIVFELVKILNPQHEIFTNPNKLIHYQGYLDRN